MTIKFEPCNKCNIIQLFKGVLADYNLLVDKLNTDAERTEITSEVADLKTQNESESRDVDAIFAEKQGKLEWISFKTSLVKIEVK